jgi:hypothetical protein
MQWDEGAFHQFESSSTGGDAVGDCLLRMNSLGLSNNGCLKDYLATLGTGNDQDVYFEYEKQTGVNVQTDACIVFTGAVKHNNTMISKQFLPCSASHTPVLQDSCSNLHSTSSIGTCQIPSMIWSGGSKNKVPVALNHLVDEVTPSKRRELALAYFKEAQHDALCALNQMTEYVNTNLEVVLFSGEGDSLHQMFDCMVQGPYARVDLWSRGSQSGLPVPYWARDTDGQGISRTLDLPCAFEKLEQDMQPPFTCGGQTRRAIIKYFVRNHINSAPGGVNGGSSLTEQLIRAQIEKLKKAWTRDSEQFACQVRTVLIVYNCF